jgi:ribosome assembly protein YihI (activator of Der GTPase)
MSVNQKNMPLPSATAAAPTEETATPAPTPEVKGLDYEAIRALHGEDETAITLEDEKLDWGFYADFLRTNGMQYEDYFRQMAAYYGVAADWKGSIGDGQGTTYAQDLLRENNDTLGSFMAIHAIAKENGVALTDEEKKALEPEQMAVDICGEGATVEQLAETLEQGSHMTIEGFQYYSESLGLYSALFEKIYGINGEKLSEEEVIKALEDEGYLSCGHILFMTIDPMTGKELSEEEVAAKLEQAQKLVKNNLYLGVLMVKAGKADGMVAGAINSTGDVLRPALQIIKRIRNNQKIFCTCLNS